MNAERYNMWTESLKEHPQATRFVVCANKGITYLYYAAYPLFLAYSFAIGDPFAWRAFLLPTIGFLLVSVARKLINRPRPYETLAFEPLIRKNTVGKSFPSRHAYSAMVIAVTIFNRCTGLGIFLVILAGCMATLRVLGGVHYPSDVIAGAAFGVLFGMLEVLP